MAKAKVTTPDKPDVAQAVDKAQARLPVANRRAGLIEKKAMKNAKRAQLLGQMPKGGVAVEIGVWRGEFSRSILDQIMPEKLFLIDPWKNFSDHDEKAFSGRSEDAEMDAIHAEVRRRYAAEIETGRVVVLRDMSTVALTGFDDESISFAYVDGDHSYDGVKADLACLWPKMKFGGVMAFDDYHRRGWWGDGVLRAIHEFIGQKPSEVRVMTVIGAQIALQKIAPLEG